ncbi:MAG: hypothetical protein GEV03_17210 [Streptosporangiales bacterium]|nr:hypothetical protein [Streptosporangiales bacterium]
MTETVHYLVELQAQDTRSTTSTRGIAARSPPASIPASRPMPPLELVEQEDRPGRLMSENGARARDAGFKSCW